jgi:CHAT domain-containing protein
VLILATHALSAGEFGLREPALVVTPAGADDGLLTASEIARLDLPLDLAVLSGCSTAGPDGTPRALMFSGLALSFLQAGTRNLLVSHYEVEDGFSARFVPDVNARLDEDADASPAEALRASMESPLADPSLASYHHPRHRAAYTAFGGTR